MPTQITPLTEPLPSRREPFYFTERMEITLPELAVAFAQLNTLVVEINALAAAAGYPNAQALADAIADIIAASDTKNTLVDADLFEIRNSADGTLWNTSWAYIKASMKTYFDSLDAGWLTLTLQNGFTDYAGTTSSCRKTSSGVVNVKAALANTGTRTTGTVVFTLPVGSRPNATIYAAVSITGTAALHMMAIRSTGACEVFNMNWPGATISAINFSFIAG